jgi:hypothetical protein
MLSYYKKTVHFGNGIKIIPNSMALLQQSYPVPGTPVTRIVSSQQSTRSPPAPLRLITRSPARARSVAVTATFCTPETVESHVPDPIKGNDSISTPALQFPDVALSVLDNLKLKPVPLIPN